MRSTLARGRETDDARRLEVQRLLTVTVEWASRRSDVRGVALVGSWARGTAEMGSDVDLVVLTFHVDRYAADEEWTRDLGAEAILRTAAWGAVTERRVRAASGLEIELNLAPPHWAAIYPIDPGTRSVVAGGMRVLHDPDGLLRALARMLP
ncbi:MAG TPA: nucleotidyltransferase domain-containing protein [Solirubrobacteraceae bacterium]|jgi:hypothetical protein|nr:nucleotidyltransferase domain-containing protein [Solirubrobacteraceae bacterium]